MINAVAIDDEPLALNVIETFCAQIDYIDLQKSFTKPTEALKYLKKFPADLLFLDIRMPAMGGISLFKSISQNTMVIFTTAYSEYAAESYELNAIDYLLKPINQKRFMQAVAKAKEYYTYINKSSDSMHKEIFIRADFSLIKIALSDIQYVEGLGDYLKVFIRQQKTVVARMTMKEISDILPSDEFIRVHRSFIIPKSKIISIRNKEIKLPERDIPIGNTYMEGLGKIFDSRG